VQKVISTWDFQLLFKNWRVNHNFCNNLHNPKDGWRACNKYMFFIFLISHFYIINFQHNLNGTTIITINKL
jgi:hypothetical protein